MGGMMEVGTG